MKINSPIQLKYNANQFLFYVAQGARSVLIVWWLVHGQESAMEIGLLVAVGQLSSFVFGPFSGYIVDRYNRDKVLAISTIMVSIVPFSYMVLIANKIWLLPFALAGEALVAFLTNTAQGALQSIIQQKVGKILLVKTNSYVSLFSNGGYFLGVSIIGIFTFSQTMVMRSFFVISVISLIAGTVCLTNIVTDLNLNNEANRDSSKGFINGVKYLGTMRNLWPMVILGVIPGISVQILNSVLALYAKMIRSDLHGYIILENTYMLSVFLGGLAAPKLQEKLGDNHLLFGALVLSVPFFAVFAFTKSLLLVMIAMGAVGFLTFVVALNIKTFFQQVVDPVHFGMFNAGRIMIGNVVFVLTSLISGKVANLETAGWVLAFPGIFSILALFLVTLEKKKQTNKGDGVNAIN